MKMECINRKKNKIIKDYFENKLINVSSKWKYVLRKINSKFQWIWNYENPEKNMLKVVCNTYKLAMQSLKNELIFLIERYIFVAKYRKILRESNILKTKSKYIPNHVIL